MSEESRQIAEAVGSDRDRRAHEVRLRAERRERIATAIYAAQFARTTGAVLAGDRRAWSNDAIRAADEFMAELDRRRAAELAEALP